MVNLGAAIFRYVEWLLVWLLEIRALEFNWDSVNWNKNAIKHGVSRIEIEEIFRLGMGLPLGMQIQPFIGEMRFAIVGPTYQNRVLTVVFTLRDGKIRPISTRPAHRKERIRYEEILSEIAQSV